MRNHKRQAISGIMQVLILVGIVGALGGIILTTSTDLTTNMLSSDALEIKKITIKNTDTASHITGIVKNSGSSDVVGLEVTIDLGSGNTFTQVFNPSDLRSGMTSSVSAMITDTNGDSVFLTTGQKVIVIVEATTANGSVISETLSIRPT